MGLPANVSLSLSLCVRGTRTPARAFCQFGLGTSSQSSQQSTIDVPGRVDPRYRDGVVDPHGVKHGALVSLRGGPCDTFVLTNSEFESLQVAK